MSKLDGQRLDPYLNARQVSEYLGISRSSVYQLIHTKGFPCVVINRRILIPRDPFLEYMNHLLELQMGGQQ